MRRAVVLSFFIVPVLLIAVSAGATPVASVFVKDLVNRGMAIVVNPDYTAAQREQAFGLLFSRDFDVPRIARFVVGRYWKRAGDADRRDFAGVYSRFVVHGLTAQLDKYRDQVVSIAGTRAKGDDVVVATDLIKPTGGPPTRLTWTVHCDGDNCKIVDVDVDGVSMLLSQRDEFATLIERNGGTVAGLTRALREKIADN